MKKNLLRKRLNIYALLGVEYDFLWANFANLASDTGALWTLEFNNLFKMRALTLELVLLAKNLYNLTANL